MSVTDPAAAGRSGLPERSVTANRLVAYNLTFFRKAADLGQQEFGEPLGWSAASVSAAERSWDSRRVKKFDADEIVQIASVLGVPFVALFLPPEDHGTAARYVLRSRGSQIRDLRDLLPPLLPDSGANTAVMEAYRKRVIAAGVSDRLEDPSERGIVNYDVAARVLHLAQRTADEAIDEARAQADQTLGKMRSETEAVLAMARLQAEQITGDARARAVSLERDAQERHRQAMGSLVQTREELVRRVDDLRAFEREYRGRLKAFFESHYRDLLAGEMRPEAKQAVEELRRRAAKSPGQQSALLLREDGTYDVLQFGRNSKGETGAQGEQPSDEESSDT